MCNMHAVHVGAYNAVTAKEEKYILPIIERWVSSGKKLFTCTWSYRSFVINRLCTIFSYLSDFPLKHNQSALERMLIFFFSNYTRKDSPFKEGRNQIRSEIIVIRRRKKKNYSCIRNRRKMMTRLLNCLSYEELILGYVRVINCDQLTPIMRHTLALYS